MKVLVACEFSGRVRDAFIKRGHDAMSCDLLPTEQPGPHYQGDVFDIINDGWDMMIAHPPCTWLCQAMRTNATRKDRPLITAQFPAKRQEAFEFVMKLSEANIAHIAIENPIGYLNGNWRRPDQIIRPWMFGHGYRKDVCLWLKNLPMLKSTNIVDGRKRLDFWSNKRNPDGKSLKSITFQGIADAMAEQWGNLPTESDGAK
ncbi:MAG TPA: DNA cytosine methyltransferase [Phycisphaerae bacterium]|nr:DNA cytosine methyltransferase [Phycisphaerae bacterium]